MVEGKETFPSAKLTKKAVIFKDEHSYKFAGKPNGAIGLAYE